MTDLNAIERFVEVVRQVAAQADDKQRKRADAILERAEALAEAGARARMSSEELGQEARRVEEEQYRKTARERLETVVASRGMRDVTSPRSFEYAVMELSREEAAGHLNKAGSLGWELVSALPGADGRHVLYMKRDVWLAAEPKSGKLSASAMPAAKAATAAAGGMAFAGFYYESGPDMDADGDVDGGLFDSIQNAFG